MLSVFRRRGLRRTPEPERLPEHVSVETIFGPMSYPPAGDLVTDWLTAHGSWEPAECAALTGLIRPGAHVLDVGAHVGYMTLLAAARVGATGSVLSIEANPTNFALLQANISRAGASSVRAVNAAAWRTSGGTLDMALNASNSGDHRVYAREGATESVAVPAIAIDDLLEGRARVDVAKVDVQGTDHVALEGMRRTIERDRPTILVEFWPLGIEELGDSPAATIGLYREMGYEPAMLERPALAPGASNEIIVEAARNAPHQYCTLVLHPVG